ncbi:MAG: replication initiator protein A [Gemmatimonadaceae bacterium]|nr:replication initiator protein A [Gemmatimonadaceae bacterium]
MNVAARNRASARAIVLDRSLEALPFFRLSDSADDSAITYSPPAGGRWRVLPSPGDRLPGTFDQDIYVELLRRYHEAGFPADGCITFTLHAFLRAIGRRVDGRTYEQLRGGLARLHRTTAESTGAYLVAGDNSPLDGSFTLLSAVAIDRRRLTDREQLSFFPALESAEPGEAKVTISPVLRANIAANHIISLSPSHYLALSSPVARRLYRLLEVARAEGQLTWRATLESLAEQLPLAQRFPSHLQRVLQPAHEMLLAAGIARDIRIKQIKREWTVDYIIAGRAGTLSGRDGTH